MLVLSRKEGETIVLKDQNGGELATIRFNKATGTIKVGIDAPPQVIILRGELDAPAVITPEQLKADEDFVKAYEPRAL
jgi:carbon storage regulator CsrA